MNSFSAVSSDIDPVSIGGYNQQNRKGPKMQEERIHKPEHIPTSYTKNECNLNSLNHLGLVHNDHLQPLEGICLSNRTKTHSEQRQSYMLKGQEGFMREEPLGKQKDAPQMRHDEQSPNISNMLIPKQVKLKDIEDLMGNEDDIGKEQISGSRQESARSFLQSFSQNCEPFHQNEGISNENPKRTNTIIEGPQESVFGFSLDEYEIERLAKGGQGLVFRLRDKKHKHNKVLKIYHKTREEEFYNEADYYLLRIDSYKSCKFLKTKEEFGIIIEAGVGDLSNFKEFLLKDNVRLNEEELMWLAGWLTNSLSELHESGCCHRDIKPHNIIITDRLVPQLIDFGLATQIRPVNKSLTVAGTPGYIDPVILQKRGGFTEDELIKADFYSLGIVLMEIASPDVCLSKKDIGSTIEENLSLCLQKYPEFGCLFQKFVNRTYNKFQPYKRMGLWENLISLTLLFTKFKDHLMKGQENIEVYDEEKTSHINYIRL